MKLAAKLTLAGCIVVLLVNAGPPPKYGSVELALSHARLHTESDRHEGYSLSQNRVGIQASFRDPDGVSFTAELGGGWLEPRDRDGTEFYAAARVGRHWRYAGLEGGLALASSSLDNDGPWISDGPAVTVHVWAGLPVLFLHASLLDVHATTNVFNLSFGLGHQSSVIRAEAGIRLVPHTSAARDWFVKAQAMLTSGFWLGAAGSIGNGKNFHVAATARLDF